MALPYLGQFRDAGKSTGRRSAADSAGRTRATDPKAAAANALLSRVAVTCFPVWHHRAFGRFDRCGGDVGAIARDHSGSVLRGGSGRRHGGLATMAFAPPAASIGWRAGSRSPTSRPARNPDRQQPLRPMRRPLSRKPAVPVPGAGGPSGAGAAARPGRVMGSAPQGWGPGPRRRSSRRRG